MAHNNGQSALSNERTKKLVAQLESKDEAERAAAEQTIGEMEPEEISPLFVKMNKELDRWIFRGMIGVLILWAVIVMFLEHECSLYWFGDYLRILAGALLSWLPIYLFFHCGVGRFKHKRLVQTLAKVDDVRYAGRLTPALMLGDKEARSAVETSLIRLLPRLQANEAALLKDEPRQILRNVLSGSVRSGKNTELVLAVLKAFEQVGDKKELPVVKKLAAGKTKASRDYRVRQAAQECLLFLQERIEGHSPDSTLLRAAGTETSPNVLLRPAGETQETNSQQLLRANVAAAPTAAQVQTITQENTHA